MSELAATGPGARGAAGRLGGAERLVILLLVAFLVVFPKGGIKVGGVPLTWGYLLLALSCLPTALLVLRDRSAPVLRTRLQVLAALVPFQLVAWAGLLANGVDGVGFAISFVFTFFFIPVAFVLALGVPLDRTDAGYLLDLVRRALFWVAVYGIVLFVYRILTGEYIEVPYLTVNAGDMGTLGERYNDRVGVSKLIATYNNGNIYGICMMLWMPLFVELEPSRFRRTVVRVAVFLTLSRTVWLGMLLAEVLRRVYVRRPTFRALALLSAVLVALAVGIVLALRLLLDLEVSFLFDRSLGGRSGQWAFLENMTLLPARPFLSIDEMVYLSILRIFGVVGLVAFLVAMVYPLVLMLLGAVPYARSRYKRAIVSGLAIYLFMAVGDGALLLIPVGAFYWFLVSLLLSANPWFAGSEPGAARGGG